MKETVIYDSRTGEGGQSGCERGGTQSCHIGYTREP